MSNIQRMYAVPSSPFSFSPEEVAQAREDLAHAEREAASATSWGHRTRAEQEAKSLRARLRGAVIQADVDARHEAVNCARPMSFQAVTIRGVEQGRYAPTKPYFGAQDADMPNLGDVDELVWLKAKATRLQSILDDPAADAKLRTTAQLELPRILQRIEAITQARNPVTEIGKPATAGHMAANTESPVSFEALAFMVDAAREAGRLK